MNLILEVNKAILGPEELEKHAVEIARNHLVKKSRRLPNWLIPELNKNYKYITEVYKKLTSDDVGSAPLVPAAEWLLDNFYIIEEQVKDIRHNLSKKYYAKLPILKNGYLKGYPRVYAIALELAAHTDGMIDEKTLVSFIQGYQSQVLLSVGELWAMAIMLRVALIENISSLCEKIINSQDQWRKADQVAELIEAGEKEEAEYLSVIIAELRNADKINFSFVEHLVRRLRKQGSENSRIIASIDEKLVEDDSSVEKVAGQEHQIQAARQVSMGNSITSLRMVSTLDWNELFESLSQVEQILRQDPQGIYEQMDFESRDYYRHQVEKLARLFNTSETLVARKVIECSADNHVGYYLIGSGRKELEAKIGSKFKGVHGILGSIKKRPGALYFGSMALLTLLLTGLFVAYSADSLGYFSLGVLLLTGLAVLIPVSDIAITIINLVVSHLYTPALLPKLELNRGIPEDLATLVIVPTLLPNSKRVKELLEQLEIYYLANKEENLYFALVGDFKDAAAENLPEDKIIVKTALDGIAKLNARYKTTGQAKFYYFHRHRQYNTAQGKWMGWERKRGAIIELNDLLRGVKNTSYKYISGDLAENIDIKFVITLDADTNLPIGTAKKLIGTLAHPLNKAVVNKEKGIVVEGYGILQPRIGINLISANSTIFSKIFAGQGGIDPYTTAVSDVYQDLFGEGIFTGKGIYELEVFQGLLQKAIPENAVLSHDLLEGSYLRAGLVTDIELVDGYPAKYNSFAMRLHRWVRGDWQLLPWLTSRGKALSAVSRWKIFDNLRRSLLNPALMLLVMLGFTILPGSSLIWLGLVLITAGLPVISYLLGSLLSQNAHISAAGRNTRVIWGLKATISQSILQLLFIPYQAFLMTNAILKTLVRVYITKRNMLEWVTAADMEVTLQNDAVSFFRKMWVSPLLGLTVFLLALVYTPGLSVLAGGLLVLWAAAPFVAFNISQEYVEQGVTLQENDLQELRRLARKTWSYFEDLVTAKEHYLPPDNYQESPPNGIAHRTSPTNIGMLLVSILTARDLGYLGTGEMCERLDQTITTIEKMEKWEGHLFNWYDTTTLEVLRPRYVSTVDSGNLVGYLIVLQEGLKEYALKPQMDLAMGLGLRDTINLLNEDVKDKNTGILTSLEVLIEKGARDEYFWQDLLDKIHLEIEDKGLAKLSPWGKKVLAMVKAFKKELFAENLDYKLQNLIQRVNNIIEGTKFSPLFEAKRQLFSIGYNIEEGRLTKSYYDLLASEARQASYIAIARGEVDQKHWFRLGRKLTMVEGSKGLVSWTGTMFEYLMPLLIMRNYENSLLDETYAFVVKAQKKYGKKRQIPWGTSESAYYAFDISLNYQYKAFGVPELGFKRGLANDMVVAPYATVLALPIDPLGALENIKGLINEGLDGQYGLYEAVDYTPARLAPGKRSNIIKNFMVHHQGMSLLALNNFLNENIMQRRFHDNPVIKSAELLLQERVPLRTIITKEHQVDFIPVKRKEQEAQAVIRKFGLPETELPQMHLLSNGSYSVMVTNGGSGYSKNQDIAVARWQGNLRGTSSGIFLFIQNINSNTAWSATFEPFNEVPQFYKAVFSPDKAEFFRKDGNIETHTEIVVSTEDNAEVRKVTLTNNSQHSRVMEVTSYCEVVLAHPEADIAHPAFSNLFVTTELINEGSALLAARRPRSEGQQPLWAFHTFTVEGEVIGNIQYETDRSKFIGRNRDISNPVAMEADYPLSNTVGPVLDPIMSIRGRVRIEAGQTVRLSYSTGIADSRQKALEMAEKYHDPKAIERTFELAWNRSQIEASYLGLKATEEEAFLAMVPAILLPGPSRRKGEHYILNNLKGQSGLWPFGISGDLPVVLVSIKEKEHIDLVYRLLKAHEYWRVKGLKVDLVFLNEDESSYTQPIQDMLREAISVSHARDLLGGRGGVFILNVNIISEEDKVLLHSVARIVLKGDDGPLEEQLSWPASEWPEPKFHRDFLPEENIFPGVIGQKDFNPAQLEFYNGLGGFTSDGREYVIQLREGQQTPAPWINVIANARFGFNISEVGAGYTWAENSRENKLTPWSNDPITDPPGEVFYIRDEKTGVYWSLTPLPIREQEEYVIRHGLGYTTFEHYSQGIAQQLTEFAALEEPVKLSLVSLKNISSVSRELTLTYYLRPVLGVSEQVTAQYISTEAFGQPGTLLLRNSYNSDYPGRIAFMDTSEHYRSITGDRMEFIGLNNSLRNPAAMAREGLSGTVGAGLDPCGAVQVKVNLQPGEVKEITFLFGQGKDLQEVQAITGKFNNTEIAKMELAKVKQTWQHKLEKIQVRTADKSFDFLLNGWLQYQVISCRLWSRAAFYQSGGAYGFRDQLQDVMAVAYTWPELTRKQILLHAAHQFIEGDVQHWWHPGVDKGIRTRYSDDFLWLPYVTADYIQCTADWSILDEIIPYLEDDPLPEHEDERYIVPRTSGEAGDLYEHCIRALENALKFGEHGIPLMGSGDWNDGMNTVGNQGKGESVWLGWFLYTVLKRFIPICLARQDQELAQKYASTADQIVQSIEKYAWDGSWYRRAYFDDGTPLGSVQNTECKIDAIAQSWSVISGAGNPARAEEAMLAVENYLIDNEDGIIKLLTPPFHEGDLEPGYIKGYVPGVRENGGQYTHAAVWTILAFAKLGKGDKVWELFHLINPINHARTAMECARYKVEPYVVAADVYAVYPNKGRGGWTWYTGAAGWMYRLGIEHIIGLKKFGDKLLIDPCIPKDWREFKVRYRFENTLYHIYVINPEGVNKGLKKISLDDEVIHGGYINLINDEREHLVEIVMGELLIIEPGPYKSFENIVRY